jgi:excisionase family DNA binding protein
MKNKEFLSIPQAAKLLGLSRVAVFKKVKDGKIKAVKVGRQFAIPRDEILSASSADIQGQPLTDKEKEAIAAAVEKTVKEYGEVLELLGKE